ncbi:hypothetical protein HWV62_16168 [Athelia sp. TMB]|nr:hypothetical protein HWV62_16168 [Athelia sp. TMB]
MPSPTTEPSSHTSPHPGTQVMQAQQDNGIPAEVSIREALILVRALQRMTANPTISTNLPETLSALEKLLGLATLVVGAYQHTPLATSLNHAMAVDLETCLRLLEELMDSLSIWRLTLWEIMWYFVQRSTGMWSERGRIDLLKFTETAGFSLIQRGSYRIWNSDDEKVIPRADISTSLQPNMTVEMSIVIRKQLAQALEQHTNQSHTCPRCRHVSREVMPSSGWLYCQRCGSRFHTTSDDDNIISPEVGRTERESAPQFEDIQFFRRISILQDPIHERAEMTDDLPASDDPSVERMRVEEIVGEPDADIQLGDRSLSATAQAFSQFETHISPWYSPHEWHLANKLHLLSGIKLAYEAQQRTSNEELANAHAFLDTYITIYPRLSLYVFIHSTVKWQMVIETTLRNWMGSDRITAIGNHQKISMYLQGMFFDRLYQLDPDLHSRHIFEALLALDVVDLSAQLAILLMNDNQHREFLSRRHEPAQALVDLLQARLDYRIESPFKEHHLRALIYLSERSQKYPEALVIKDMPLPLKQEHDGHLGYIYRGSMGKCYVAIKVRQTFKKSAMTETFKAFMLDVAQGLEYLHSQNIVHASLKGSNILVSGARRAYLADFGHSFYHDAMSAQLRDMDYEYQSRMSRSPNWMAPEVFAFETRWLDKASDAYSFAMVCYEMFSGRIPFVGKREHLLIRAIVNGERPERPLDRLSQTRGLTDSVWDIIVTCWRQRPEERPTAAQIIQRLHALPGLLPDDRPLDHHDMQPPRKRSDQYQNPFAALEGVLKAERKA